MEKITQFQEETLRLLGKFGFLTLDQISKVSGYAKKTAYKYFPLLKEKGYCSSVTTEGSRLEVHHLTLKGAKQTADHTGVTLEEIKHLKSDSTTYSSDFYHRIRTVDLLIAFEAWLNRKEFELIAWDTYFDKTGNQKKSGDLKPKTRVQTGESSYVDPDAIFAYVTDNGQKITLIETSRGKETKLVLEKIRKTMFAIYEGKVSEKYKTKTHKFAVTPKFLISFETESLMKSTMAAVNRDIYMKRFDRLNDFLFFGLHSKVVSNWEINWYTVDGKQARPL